MKKIMILILFTAFTVVAVVFAAEDEGQGLRPTQKIMRARDNILFKLERNLTAKQPKMSNISNLANKLAMQTKKSAENLADPEAKELTLAISSLAEELYTASTTKYDERILRGNLDKIKAKCAECHTKFRK